MIALDDIPLPDGLVWSDEFSWSPVSQSRTYSLDGSVIVEEAQSSARDITLEATEGAGAWCPRTLVLQLKQKEAVPGGVMSLVLHDGQRFSVVFRRDPMGIEVEQVVPYADPLESDKYNIKTIRLLVVEE